MYQIIVDALPWPHPLPLIFARFMAQSLPESFSRFDQARALLSALDWHNKSRLWQQGEHPELFANMNITSKYLLLGDGKKKNTNYDNMMDLSGWVSFDNLPSGGWTCPLQLVCCLIWCAALLCNLPLATLLVTS